MLAATVSDRNGEMLKACTSASVYQRLQVINYPKSMRWINTRKKEGGRCLLGKTDLMLGYNTIMVQRWWKQNTWQSIAACRALALWYTANSWVKESHFWLRTTSGTAMPSLLPTYIRRQRHSTVYFVIRYCVSATRYGRIFIFYIEKIVPKSMEDIMSLLG